MRLAELAEASRDVAGTAARGRKVERLAELLRAAAPADAAIAVAYLRGTPRQGRVGVGGAALRGARAEAVPDGAASLTVADVDAACEAISAVSGAGSAAERAARLRALFGRATRAEQDFLARLLLGEMRQGALEGVLESAIARAAGVPLGAVQRAAMLQGDLPAVAALALERGAAGLSSVRLELGRPVQPMLAQSAEDPEEAFARLGAAAAETKLDGARIQLHRAGDEVRVFTRAGNDVTAAVPELVALARALPLREAVLDGEAIALRADGRPQPFQVTMRRFGQRADVSALREALPLHGVLFDALHLGGEDLLDRPDAERRRALEAVAPAHAVPRRLVATPAELETFLAEQIAAGHEGAMLKDPAAAYEAGRRGASWLKLKRPHTLDLVVLAAEWGSGRREGWLSNLHLGARDPEGGGFVMLGKTFKGLTDALLRWQTERFLGLALSREGPVVHVRPEQVVEIAFDGVQRSPHYPGGVALRFARVRRYRPDKRPEEADTIATVRALLGAEEARSAEDAPGGAGSRRATPGG